MTKTNGRGFILILGVMAMLVTGTIYAWSILKVPFASELGMTETSLSFNFSLTMCMFCLGGIISGVLLGRIGQRILLAVSALMSFAGFWFVSDVSSGEMLRLYLSYGILCGLGIGIAYNAVISVVSRWYTGKNGVSFGLLMMSFGASALILGNIAERFLFPSIGRVKTFRLLGILTGAVLLAAAVFLKSPETCESDTPETDKDDSGMSTGEMLAKPSFWRFFFFLVTACAVGNGTISMARDTAASVGADASLAALLAGLLSLCNGGGRLFAGYLFDRIGQRATMTVDGIITIIAPAVVALSIVLHSVPLCAAGLCLSGFSYSFQPPVTTSAVLSFYGRRCFSANFSVMNLMMIPSSFAATAAGMLYTNTGSYLTAFVLLTAVAVISFCLNLRIRHA